MKAAGRWADKRFVDELTKEFLAESGEGLDRMERCLTELEIHPDDRELLDETFRTVHTIKGTTGFLGLPRLEKLAHAGENLLDSLRSGRVRACPDVVSGLLQLMDGLRAIVRLIESTGGEGVRAADEDSALIAVLARLNGESPVKVDAGEHCDGVLEKNAPIGASVGGPISGMSEQTLRVSVNVLNRMMNLVGELVLTRNQMLQTEVVAAGFTELARRLDSVTAELRETVMQARMQPVGHVFGKFPRMVRDLAKSCGKSVRLEFSGQDTGLDKSLLEAIKDPLTHAVRNAVDHGLEDGCTRELAGKPAEGLVRMTARQHNGCVVIEVSDDGRGISTERVLQKAQERQLISAEQAAGMSQREALQIIFRPGFSTAEAVTHVSGRGVGLDVVQANVEQIGGTVEIESREGQGTVLRLRVPLTLAIVPALIVESAGERFCVPQSTLSELVYVPRREAAAALERMGDAEVYRLRDALLPAVRLDAMLELDDAGKGAEHGFYLVVLEAEGSRFGLVVDELMTPEEIVVKPLSASLRELGLFSGATVLGNGALALILDVAALAARAGVKSVAEQTAAKVAEVGGDTVPGESYLVFEDRVDERRPERRALPLKMVERIETVSVADVEYAGGEMLLRYRGEMLRLDDGGGVVATDSTATVLICRVEKGRERVGIVVRRVVDVAPGELLERDVRKLGERLVLVSERVTVLCEAWSREERLGAVA